MASQWQARKNKTGWRILHAKFTMKNKRPHGKKCICYFCTAYDKGKQNQIVAKTKTKLPDDWICDCKSSTIKWIDKTKNHPVIRDHVGWFCMGCLTEFTMR